MTILPNKNVWEEADEYEHVSRLCLEQKLYWPSIVNAALAVEIYLKSFISKDCFTPAFGGPVNHVFAEKVNGHSLLDLYSKIHPSMIEKINLLNQSKFDIPKILEKYNFAFTRYRYSYEAESPVIADDTLSRFATHLKYITHTAYKENFS
ncbi:conserved hypothetical protein [Pseudomonas sp. 8Z]|uniref:hypothetical protein n=1 Tax=Pseudomonas sp. 8Z TaxID=2653166 RepID=UPI0012F1F90E|nr:hypothetical protein [Pseudomonas sp. 8Z]VXC30350.1 conserved hypothetical protein [Pseudomonas sp. 8Z]